MRKPNPSAIVMFVWAACSWATPILAVEAVASFSGTVESITDRNDSLPAGVIVGAAVSGQFRYETVGSSVTFPFNDYADYTFAAGGMSISVVIAGNTFTATTPTPGVPDLELTNDQTNLYDNFRLKAATPTVFPSDLGDSYILIFILDQDTPYELVDSLDLPLTNADFAFAEANTKVGYLSSTDGISESWFVTFHIDALSFEPLAVRPSTWSGVKTLFR